PEVKTAEATASAAAAEATKSCRRSNGFTAQIPLHTIEAYLFRARNRAHHFAGVITNRNLHVGCRNCFQVVTDRSSRRWVGAAEILRSARVAAQTNVVVPEHAGSHVEKENILVEHLLRAKLLQRADVVADVNAAAVSADDEIVVAWMHEDVVDAHARQAGHEFLPFLAAVQ